MKKLLKNHVGALVTWIALLAVAIFMLPNVNALTRAHSNIKLPSNVQSEVAETIGNKWGSSERDVDQIALVFNNKSGAMDQNQKDRVQSTINALKDNKSKYGIKSMLAPNDNAATKKQLKSKDGSTWIVQINVSKKHAPVSKINDQLQEAIKTKGIRTYVTGAAILNDDFSASIQEGIKKTEAISVVFIFIVLIIVFRSPIVPLISLATVAVSFLTSFSLVTNLTKLFNFPYSNFTQVFMVIVLFGIGTDYNILLYDKFKSYLSKGMSNWESTKRAQHEAGKTILFSGSSILIGFSALGLAKFSIYRSAVGVAVGVATLLVVLLTLNPFFMATLGKKMFWPAKNFEENSTSRLWRALSSSSLRHPIIYLIVLAGVLAPFVLGPTPLLNYDNTYELANNIPSKEGLRVVQDHFSKGTAMPSYLYIKADHPLDNEKDLKLIDQITQKLQNSDDVSSVNSVTEPEGSKVKELYVNNQLGAVNSGVDQARNGLSKLQSGSNQMTDGIGQLQNGTQALANGLTTMSGQLESQMSGSNASQLAQLQAGLPKINAGIQQLNGALQSSGAGINTAGVKDNLVNAGNQAKNIGNNLQAAGAILAGLQKGNAGSISTAQILAQYRAVEDKAQLNPMQKAAMEQALGTILSGVNNQANAQKAAVANSLQGVAKNLQAAGLADQSLGNSLQSVGQTAQTLQGMMGQVAVLKAQVNTLASASNVALPGANEALDKLSSGLSQVQGAVGQASAGVDQLNNGTNALYQRAPELSQGIGQVNTGLGQGQQYLTGLGNSAAANTFYIPKGEINSKQFKQSTDVYLSKDKKATKFIIIFATNPSSAKSAAKSQELSAMVRKSLKGTDLKNAQVAMGGQSSTIEDLKNTADSDFFRTAAIMIIGIGLALMFVTRSLLQPVYILFTLVASYFVALDITSGLAAIFTGNAMLTWNTPFFSFIMLIALGVDYSIFLMRQYLDLKDGSPSQRILKAATIIGVVVISAAIILGGTFAALIPSGIPTLIEVAVTVIIGLLILVFILPIVMSALVKLTYDRNNKSNKK